MRPASHQSALARSLSGHISRRLIRRPHSNSASLGRRVSCSPRKAILSSHARGIAAQKFVRMTRNFRSGNESGQGHWQPSILLSQLRAPSRSPQSDLILSRHAVDSWLRLELADAQYERLLDPREKRIGKVQTRLLTLSGTAGYEVLALIGVRAELSASRPGSKPQSLNCRRRRRRLGALGACALPRLYRFPNAIERGQKSGKPLRPLRQRPPGN